MLSTRGPSRSAKREIGQAPWYRCAALRNAELSPPRYGILVEGRDSGDNRVLRGGSWNNDAVNLRSANRNNNDPWNRNTNNGFRLLCPQPGSLAWMC